MRPIRKAQVNFNNMAKANSMKNSEIWRRRRTVLSLLVLTSITGCSGGSSSGHVNSNPYDYGRDPYYGRASYRRSPTRRSRNRRRY